MKFTDIRLVFVALVVQGLLLLTPMSDWCGPSISQLQYRLAFCTGVLFVIGLIVLLAFYRFTAAVVGNRIPKLQWTPLYNYFFIAKPLELIWRFVTSPLRCLPDVLIIGEVRCGTTTLSEHLKSLPGVHGPFCPFVHPLDGKESFYFAGTYFGCVHPYLYRAVFPFKITKWFYKHVLGQPFLVMDGCAQYLTSPIAPALMRQALATNDIRIFVCLRDPVEQNTSWWNFEQASMAWFDSMGLSRSISGGLEYMRVRYPPPTLLDAHTLSLRNRQNLRLAEPTMEVLKRCSLEVTGCVAIIATESGGCDKQGADVAGWYDEAEQLSVAMASRVVSPWTKVPNKFLTWPNGQLSSFARNGCFSSNLARWFKWFNEDNFEYFEVTEYKSRDLKALQERILAALPTWYGRFLHEHIRTHGESRTLLRYCHANKGGVTSTHDERAKLDANAAGLSERQYLAKFYRPHNEKLFAMIGRSYDWHSTNPAYQEI